MATIFPTEIVIEILNNIQSTQDLYSSLLVNRIWCKITIPILWELPFGQECCTNDKKLKKKAICIRTYISCMDTQARTLLTQNGFDLSSSPPQATFDYPSFAHKFIINNLISFISIYSPQINSRKSKKSRILFREMCKFIIKCCKFVDSFKITEAPRNNYLRYSDLIGSILELPGAPEVFKKLKSFTLTLSGAIIQTEPLYKSLTLICDNILNMDLTFPYSKLTNSLILAELISAQKRLENLSIVDNYNHFDSLEAIISQKETLKSLRLHSCYFRFKKSSSIEQFVSLQELYINDCRILKSGYLFLASSSFTQLSSFYYIHTKNNILEWRIQNQEFIVKILETANTNLRNICLYLYSKISTIPFDTFSAILNYCTKIRKLTLNYLSPEQVIEIFNNNFNELRIFSFYCGMGLDANELLCQMAENVPGSLETITIKMDYWNPWIFDTDSLRKFLEGWCCKGGGRNNKLRRLRIKHLFIPKNLLSPLKFVAINSEHLKVIDEFGIQFDMK